MTLQLYMDHHVPRAITIGLRLRGVDVITTEEDDTSEWDDPNLLNRAEELGRVLFTRDRHFLIEANRRLVEEISFSGIVYAHQLRVSIGTCVHDLEIIAQTGEIEEVVNKVLFLPL